MDNWQPDFTSISPLYAPIKDAANSFKSYKNWPNLSELNQYLNPALDQPISFVPQDYTPNNSENEYEPRIFLKGEVQTRENNWHDFFNALVWTSFPLTKKSFNDRHYQEIQMTDIRTPTRDAITHFDECGIVVVSSDPRLLEMIRNFQWKALFWHNRDFIRQHMRFFIIGHAIYEKGLNPYIGLCAKALLQPVDEKFHQYSMQDQRAYVDTHTRQWFLSQKSLTPKVFSPLPILGIPGWHEQNKECIFYENTNYFRPGRQNQNPLNKA